MLSSSLVVLALLCADMGDSRARGKPGAAPRGTSHKGSLGIKAKGKVENTNEARKKRDPLPPSLPPVCATWPLLLFDAPVIVDRNSPFSGGSTQEMFFLNSCSYKLCVGENPERGDFGLEMGGTVYSGTLLYGESRHISVRIIYHTRSQNVPFLNFAVYSLLRRERSRLITRVFERVQFYDGTVTVMEDSKALPIAMWSYFRPMWATSVAAQVFEALSILHSLGILLKNLSLDTLKLTNRNGYLQVIVDDFSKALIVDDGPFELSFSEEEVETRELLLPAEALLKLNKRGSAEAKITLLSVFEVDLYPATQIAYYLLSKHLIAGGFSLALLLRAPLMVGKHSYDVFRAIVSGNSAAEIAGSAPVRAEIEKTEVWASSKQKPLIDVGLPAQKPEELLIAFLKVSLPAGVVHISIAEGAAKLTKDERNYMLMAAEVELRRQQGALTFREALAQQIALAASDSIPPSCEEIKNIDGFSDAEKVVAGFSLPLFTGDIWKQSEDLPSFADDEIVSLKNTYKILGRMDSNGAFGVMYKAEETMSKVPVIIKVVQLSKPDTAEREIRALAAIGRRPHPNLMFAYEIASFLHHSVFVLEFIEGGPLIKGAKDLDSILSSAQLFAGLTHLHKLGLVHSDIKNDNVLIEAKTERVVIIDFGMATKYVIQGTPELMRGAGVSLAFDGTPQMFPARLALAKAAPNLKEGVLLESEVWKRLNPEVQQKIIGWKQEEGTLEEERKAEKDGQDPKKNKKDKGMIRASFEDAMHIDAHAAGMLVYGMIVKVEISSVPRLSLLSELSTDKLTKNRNILLAWLLKMFTNNPRITCLDLLEHVPQRSFFPPYKKRTHSIRFEPVPLKRPVVVEEADGQLWALRGIHEVSESEEEQKEVNFLLSHLAVMYGQPDMEESCKHYTTKFLSIKPK